MGNAAHYFEVWVTHLDEKKIDFRTSSLWDDAERHVAKSSIRVADSMHPTMFSDWAGRRGGGGGKEEKAASRFLGHNNTTTPRMDTVRRRGQ